MTSLKKTARIAGLWYLGFMLGPFYLLYVPSQTVVRDDAAATAARVLAHETLFRWGMLAETLGAVIFVGLALALYRLFEGVDRHRARQLVALVRFHPRWCWLPWSSTRPRCRSSVATLLSASLMHIPGKQSVCC